MPFGKWKDFGSCVTDMQSKGYSEESAKKICGDLQSKLEGFRYKAKIHSPYEEDGKRFAKIRVIDTSKSGPADPDGRTWQVTYDALRNAVGTIFDAPLIGPPEQGHDAKQEMGFAVNFDFSSGNALDVVYEITDDACWKGIQDGKYYDVSPQVYGTGEKHGQNDLLEMFYFDHVAWVPEGAFAIAEMHDFCEGGTECLRRLSAELNHSHSVTNGGSTPPAKGRQDSDQNIKNRKGETKMTDNTNIPDPQKTEDPAPQKPQSNEEVEKLETQVAELKAQLMKTNMEKEKLEREEPARAYKAENQRLVNQIKVLNEWKAEKESKAKEEYATEIIDAGVQIGLISEADRFKTLEEYKAEDMPTLKLLKEKWIEPMMLQIDSPMGGIPKAPFKASKARDNLHESVRAKFGFAPKGE